MTYRRYSEYKDSQIEWLGQVPSHWKVVSIKWLSSVLRGASPRPIDNPIYFDEEGEYAWVRIADATASDGILLETTQRLSDLGSSLSVRLDANKLFVSIAGTVGKPCITGIKACIHDGFVHFPKLKIDQRLLFRVFEAGTCYGGLGKMGTQLNLNTDTIGSIRIVVPPDNELNLILSFLDHETKKIDDLVKSFEGLIETLKEKLECLVLESRFSDGTQEIRLGHAAQLQLRPVIQNDLDSYKPLGMYNRGRGIFHKEPREMADMGDSDFFWVEKNDLVISGQFAWEGAVGLAGEEEAGCVVSHRYPILRGKEGVALTEYLFALLLTKHGDFLFNENSWGAAGRNRPLNIGLLLKEKIWLPKMETQEKIAHSVHQIKLMTFQINRQIKLLQERRTALISAAVTGKIDVRGLVHMIEKEESLETA